VEFDFPHSDPAQINSMRVTLVWFAGCRIDRPHWLAGKLPPNKTRYSGGSSTSGFTVSKAVVEGKCESLSSGSPKAVRHRIQLCISQVQPIGG